MDAFLCISPFFLNNKKYITLSILFLRLTFFKMKLYNKIIKIQLNCIITYLLRSIIQHQHIHINTSDLNGNKK